MEYQINPTDLVYPYLDVEGEVLRPYEGIFGDNDWEEFIESYLEACIAEGDWSYLDSSSEDDPAFVGLSLDGVFVKGEDGYIIAPNIVDALFGISTEFISQYTLAEELKSENEIEPSSPVEENIESPKERPLNQLTLEANVEYSDTDYGSTGAELGPREIESNSTPEEKKVSGFEAMNDIEKGEVVKLVENSRHYYADIFDNDLSQYANYLKNQADLKRINMSKDDLEEYITDHVDLEG